MRRPCVVGQPLWAVNCFGSVGNETVAPAAYLVTEETKAAGPAATDRTRSHDTTGGAVAIAHRCLLDDELALRHVHHERRVVKVARRPPLPTCCDGLEDPAVQPNRMPAGTEGQPVQVDSALCVCHRAIPLLPRLVAGRARVIRSEPRAFYGELRSQIGAFPDGQRQTAPDHELDSFKPEKGGSDGKDPDSDRWLAGFR
jgi:hypothetical protein